MTVLACVLLSCHLINENDDDDDDDGWPSIIGGDAGDPGGPAAALCKLAMEWVCQVGGKDKATVDSKHGISLWFFLPAYFETIDELFESSDDTLFNSVTNNPDHVLCALLPPSKNTGYNLRKLNHGLSLPTVHSSLQRKNFIYLMLFNAWFAKLPKHHMPDFNAKMHQNRFRLGLRPRPRWGAYIAPPDRLAGFKGTYF